MTIKIDPKTLERIRQLFALVKTAEPDKEFDDFIDDLLVFGILIQVKICQGEITTDELVHADDILIICKCKGGLI